MKVPEGLGNYLGIKEENFEKKHILKLKKAIYGLKVSPKRWFMRFSEAMKKMRFTRYDFQLCIYYWKNNVKYVILIV